jgi:hypothetical protein
MAHVRTVRQPGLDCRWRIWRAYGAGAGRLATREAAEHMCDGEFVWIVRASVDGMTWMVEEQPVTLMEVFDFTVPAMAEWVVDQTLAALGGVLIELAELDHDAAVRAIVTPESAGHFDRIHGLLLEFLKFSRAAGVVSERFARLQELAAASDDDERGAADDEHAAA